LKSAGVNVLEVSDVTGFPELLDGRVKTLHPKIHAGILADRRKDEHVKELEDHNIKPIDMVVVNLYPFEETVKKENVSLEEAVENIDIGGPTLLRAGAKNFENVVVIINPNRYDEIIKELEENNGEISLKTRKILAAEAFTHTAFYDAIIHQYLIKEFNLLTDFPETLIFPLKKVQDLRYGENPHQKAAFYKDVNALNLSVSDAKQLQGKELSFNNIVDLDAALDVVKEFEDPTAVIIKHTNPCGVAVSNNILDAYIKAHATDPMSAFGCVIGLNREVNEELAEKITSTFVECVIAPEYTSIALEIFKKKPNLRLLELKSLGKTAFNSKEKSCKNITGGMLLQTKDKKRLNPDDLKVVTEIAPTKEQISALLFAWTIVKHVKSNGIVLAKNTQTVGIGAGQMSRVDAVMLAVRKAGERSRGAVLASDAFFPFRDSIDEAAKGGITAIIQPGGSIRDQEVIDAANERKISMVLTGMRCFKH
ncbi:MAG: bifunctional phosphoribosylaminoimidazolecarboxamide formyltransferase/IMP cyclohydrolase, partial [Asgard group archaeon]